MLIQVNGKARETAEGCTLSDLLAELELDSVRVALELNRKLIIRANHAHTKLSDGDCVEIVTLVGGG